jgi:hypothetical protein
MFFYIGLFPSDKMKLIDKWKKLQARAKTDPIIDSSSEYILDHKNVVITAWR